MSEMTRASIADRLPKQFSMRMFGETIEANMLCLTTHEFDAAIEALRIMRFSLPSTRSAEPGDVGFDFPEKPFASKLSEFLG